MKKIKILLVSFALTTILLLGCSEESTTEPTPTTSAPLSKLSDIQSKVFNTSCALSGCHGGTNNQANLLLTDGNSFANLVNVQSFLFPQFSRVQPNNSANSLLIKMLKGEVSPRMPLNRDPLSAATIDSIAKWIDNGALNN
ncbi:MAG: hypothetical protein IH618_06690 [Ignavibacteriaceae bacterium]|nr:hypothetical protein [Ignavibacteriaceae bacterium]